MSESPPRFRTMHTDKWRDPTERERLVERIITLERENRTLRATLREFADLDGDQSVGALVVALRARIEGLERNLERLINERGAA